MSEKRDTTFHYRDELCICGHAKDHELLPLDGSRGYCSVDPRPDAHPFAPPMTPTDPLAADSKRIAYADPPYIGQAKRHYGKEESYAGEVDHAQLALHLQTFDGWALSASSPSLHLVLPLFPPGTRIAAWVKPFAIFKPGVNPAYAWEPVIFKPARSGKMKAGGRKAPTVRDWVSANITLKRGGTVQPKDPLAADDAIVAEANCDWNCSRGVCDLDDVKAIADKRGRALREVMDLHSIDPEDNCRTCGGVWPCPTLARIREILGGAE